MRRTPGRGDVTEVGYGMVSDVGVCHPVGPGRGGSGHHRAEVADEGLWVPLPEARR
jgi:hypothetical protein